MSAAPWYVWAMAFYQIFNAGLCVVLAAQGGHTIRINGLWATLAVAFAAAHIAIYASLL